MDGATSVEVKGALSGDVSAALTDLSKKLPEGALVRFDLAGVSAMNTRGLRSWANFLRGLKMPYEFHRCSVFFVDSANLIAEVLGKGKVISFHAPMTCASCRKSREVLLETAALEGDESFGEHRCESCRSPLEPEVSPPDYLVFLAS